MSRLLLIDDETDLQEVLAYHLRKAGHEVDQALTGDAGCRGAIESQPDLILLDIMLPDLPGTDVCRALRSDPRTSSIPIVMLTAKGEEADRVNGFRLGADDYVIKPFSITELLLRVQAILRRARPELRETTIEFGRLRIDCAAHRVWVDGDLIPLTSLELRLLRVLTNRRERVQSRENLLDDVWGIEAEVGPRTVDTSVRRLREKLKEASIYIQTVHGAGYRFSTQLADETER